MWNFLYTLQGVLPPNVDVLTDKRVNQQVKNAHECCAVIKDFFCALSGIAWDDNL